MRLRPFSAWSGSLKSILLWSLVPALIITMMLALWLSARQFRVQVNTAYDRSLLGALRSINHNISTESGGLSLQEPYLLLEFFELTANERIYYRVLTEDGLADIGNQALPLPNVPMTSNIPIFYNAHYLGQDIRIAAMARQLDPPLYDNVGGRVIIQVAEDTTTREEFITAMLLHTMERDLALVVLVVLIVVFGVLFAVRPLTRLRQELEKRPSDDLSPVEARDIPLEVQPLVAAVNLHMARYSRQAELQRQFLDDASHQLRTPLSVLRAQLSFALRENDPTEIRQALLAMREGLDRAVRTANQMLSLAHARDSPFDSEGRSQIDLVSVAQDVMRALYTAGRSRRHDIGLEVSRHEIMVEGVDWLIREAVMNLLDNAIRYTPAGGIITLKIEETPTSTVLAVEDNGVGMSTADMEKACVRFRRGAAGKNTAGAGLGLAIVNEIMARHGGDFVLHSEGSGRGCRATLVFTRKSTA